MSYFNDQVNISELVGKTIRNIAGLEKESDEVRIFTECGKTFLFYHEQDCCEGVKLEDFDGDADDLKGALITSAEVVVNEGGEPEPKFVASWTWTFYKIETNKGGIWMRWLGESNGYYSEWVDLILLR